MGSLSDYFISHHGRSTRSYRIGRGVCLDRECTWMQSGRGLRPSVYDRRQGLWFTPLYTRRNGLIDDCHYSRRSALISGLAYHFDSSSHELAKPNLKHKFLTTG